MNEMLEIVEELKKMNPDYIEHQFGTIDNIVTKPDEGLPEEHQDKCTLGGRKLVRIESVIDLLIQEGSGITTDKEYNWHYDSMLDFFSFTMKNEKVSHSIDFGSLVVDIGYNGYITGFEIISHTEDLFTGWVNEDGESDGERWLEPGRHTFEVTPHPKCPYCGERFGVDEEESSEYHTTFEPECDCKEIQDMRVSKG